MCFVICSRSGRLTNRPTCLSLRWACDPDINGDTVLGSLPQLLTLLLQWVAMAERSLAMEEDDQHRPPTSNTDQRTNESRVSEKEINSKQN